MFKPIPKNLLTRSADYYSKTNTDKWNNSTETKYSLMNVATIAVKMKSNSDMDGINIGKVKLIYDTKNSSGKPTSFKRDDKVIIGDDTLTVLSVFEAKIGSSTHHWELELG